MRVGGTSDLGIGGPRRTTRRRGCSSKFRVSVNPRSLHVVTPSKVMACVGALDGTQGISLGRGEWIEKTIWARCPESPLRRLLGWPGQQEGRVLNLGSGVLSFGTGIRVTVS